MVGIEERLGDGHDVNPGPGLPVPCMSLTFGTEIVSDGP